MCEEITFLIRIIPVIFIKCKKHYSCTTYFTAAMKLQTLPAQFFSSVDTEFDNLLLDLVKLQPSGQEGNVFFNFYLFLDECVIFPHCSFVALFVCLLVVTLFQHIAILQGYCSLTLGVNTHATPFNNMNHSPFTSHCCKSKTLSSPNMHGFMFPAKIYITL